MFHPTGAWGACCGSCAPFGSNSQTLYPQSQELGKSAPTAPVTWKIARLVALSHRITRTAGRPDTAAVSGDGTG